MSKVTSKLQVTIPKAIAEQFGIRPGTEIEWVPAGQVLRVIPPGARREPGNVNDRLKLFDQATGRIRKLRPMSTTSAAARDWKREDLYRRGRSH